MEQIPTITIVMTGGWFMIVLPTVSRFIAGWWFGTFFPYIGNVIIPTDEVHHFSEG